MVVKEWKHSCSVIKRLLNCVSACNRGAKYSLLAYTRLGLPEAEGSFQSHSLVVLQNGEQECNIQGSKGILLLIPSFGWVLWESHLLLQKKDKKENL